jgi:hypothetical protein
MIYCNSALYLARASPAIVSALAYTRLEKLSSPWHTQCNLQLIYLLHAVLQRPETAVLSYMTTNN